MTFAGITWLAACAVALLLEATAEASAVTVSLVSSQRVNELGKTFASYNVDPSCNRGFHTTAFSNGNLAAAATGLFPSRLRFGGSGADNLVYGLTPGAPECANTPPAPPPLQPGCDYITPGCLNASHWDSLSKFAADSGSEFLFGVSYGLADACTGGASWQWNATNARVLVDYVTAHNQTLWGMELGNEVNNNAGRPCSLLPRTQAAAFALLASTLADAKLQGVALVGPDSGGRDPETWLRGFLPYVKPGLLTAVTHHVYNGISRATFASPARLDNSLPEIAWYMNVVRSLAPGSEAWAGENGPIGGGDDGSCGADSVCGTFAETLWYADDMSLRAKHGFVHYQRQSFIGGAYGLTGSLSGAMALSATDPLALHPSYWTSFVWKRTLGTSVLNATSSSALVRAYAYRGAPPSPFAAPECTAALLQLVLINLDAATQLVSLPPPPPAAGARFAAWSLAPAQGGVFTASATLNGATLPTVVDAASGVDPRSFLEAIQQPAVQGAVAAGATLPPLSTTFLCYHA